VAVEERESGDWAGEAEPDRGRSPAAARDSASWVGEDDPVMGIVPTPDIDWSAWESEAALEIGTVPDAEDVLLACMRLAEAVMVVVPAPLTVLDCCTMEDCPMTGMSAVEEIVFAA